MPADAVLSLVSCNKIVQHSNQVRAQYPASENCILFLIEGAVHNCMPSRYCCAYRLTGLDQYYEQRAYRTRETHHRLLASDSPQSIASPPGSQLTPGVVSEQERQELIFMTISLPTIRNALTSEQLKHGIQMYYTNDMEESIQFVHDLTRSIAQKPYRY